MAKTKGTKRSLLTSMLCILLSLSMLIGSTFAWFTDTVRNSGNIITSGNLDIEMYWTDDPASGTWYNVEDDAYNTIFSYDNWEPGYTDVKYIKLVNKGDLALNYDLTIAPQGAVGKLAEVINVYYAINDDKLELRSDLDQLSCIGLLSNVLNGGSTASGTLLPAGTQSLFHASGEVIMTLAMTMVTSAGNEYQGESSGEFTIKALATQAPFESDSFGSDYDSQAEMPIALVATNITVPVTPTAEGTVGEEGLSIVGANAAAYLPAGVKLADGATEATLRITPNSASQSGLSVVNDEMLIPLDVHIDGVAEDNTVPIIIDLGAVMPKYLNLGNYYVVHVEDGVNQVMTQVSSRDELVAHNQFTYNSDTGAVSVAMANFSAVEMIANNSNEWKGGVDYTWFTQWTPGPSVDNPNRRIYTLTNADQLYGFARLLGKMLTQTEKDAIPDKVTVDGKEYDTWTYVNNAGATIDILNMGFNGHTVQLLNDVDLGGTDVKDVSGKKVMFYPIGYYNNTRDTNSPYALIYDRADATESVEGISSSFEAFRGTFNGNGHTISNLYQNTWDMFGDYNSGYPDGSNYYKDGMGLFGWLYGASIYNINVKNFQSDGEFTPTGVIAAYAEAAHQDADPEKGIPKDYGETTIQGISITDSNPRVYNTGNGGIVGIGGRSDTPENYGDCPTCKLIFTNITVDQSNTISALWGSWDVACGGIMGMYRGNGKVSFTNCHVAAQIDVYNDVCGNYQYYWYRYAGMIIGSIRKNVTNAAGYVVPDMSGISAENCTVRFDEWNDYYYCELVANSLASYTHDHQMSRLEIIESVKDIQDKDENWTTTGNFVILEADGTPVECFHIVKDENGNLKRHMHEDAGTETDPDTKQTVLKEDKQRLYLPFNQLFQGDGWGVKNVALTDLEDYPELKNGITIMKAEDFSKQKFETKFVTDEAAPMKVAAGAPIKVGDLFAAIGEVDAASVGVYVEKILADGTYERVIVDSKEIWSNRVFSLTEGVNAVYRVSIQDFKYCLPTVMYLEAVAETRTTTSCDHCTAANVVWTPWYPGALPTGHYYVVEHLTSYAPITVAEGADVVLDLNDKTMNFPESAAVDVGKGSTLSIVDSGANGYGAMDGFGDEYGLLKVSGGNLNLYDGAYSYGVVAINDDEAQISTKGIIWAANPEDADSNTHTNVLFTDKVSIPAEAQIFLAADAEMKLQGSIDGTKIRLVELETGAQLNIQGMVGNAQNPIEIMANGVFAYIEGVEAGQTERLNEIKPWFKAAAGYSEIKPQGKGLFTQLDLKDSIKNAFQKGKTVNDYQTSDSEMQGLITSGYCPMCEQSGVTWVKYDPAKHSLVQGGSKIHVYLDQDNCGTKEDPIEKGNFIGSYKGSTVMCVMIMEQAKVYTNGRFLLNPSNTLNIMGNGSVHSYGTSGLGLFTILGKNPTVNIYGGTYTYEGSYTRNIEGADPGYALLYVSSRSSVVNIYNNATIGYTQAEIKALSAEKKANYNVNLSGTLNMYGGTIRNGISADEWHSGNVTVQGSGVLNMYDGEIVGGQTVYRGGNVLLHSLSTMNMGYSEAIADVDMTPVVSGGTALYSKVDYDAADAAAQAKLDEKIANGEATNDAQITPVDRIPGGGNIGTKGFVGYMNFNMYNGSIEGGVVIPGYDDSIEKNQWNRLYMGGGNIYLSGAYSNNALIAGTVSSGEAYSGGNIYIRNGVKMTLTSTAAIKDGKAILDDRSIGGQGGNINVFHGAELNVEGAVITGGEAGIGGNINIGETAGENPLVKIASGQISNGKAKDNGGNIYIAGLSRLDITGGTFSGGTALNGGNIFATGADKEDENDEVIGINSPAVNISGGVFENSTAQNGGGNLYAYNHSVMNISGGTVSGGSAKNGGNISATSHATLTMTGGTVTDGAATASGGNINVTNYAQATMSGAVVIAGGRVEVSSGTVRGGNINVTENAQLTVNDGVSITDGYALADDQKNSQGGNISVTNGSKLTVNGGTISGGYSRLGGNIAVGNHSGAKSTATITGGTISGGKATINGGNMLVSYASDVTISGGQIYGGELPDSKNSGINIYVGLVDTDASGNVRKPNFTISGGTITGAVEIAGSQVSGGTEYYNANVTLSGTPQILGDSNAYHKFGMLLTTKARIDISELQSGASINITKHDNDTGDFTNESSNAAAVIECFTPSNSDRQVQLVENNVLALVAKAAS